MDALTLEKVNRLEVALDQGGCQVLFTRWWFAFLKLIQFVADSIVFFVFCAVVPPLDTRRYTDSYGRVCTLFCACLYVQRQSSLYC